MLKDKPTKISNIKKQNIIHFVLLVLIVLLLNITGRYLFTRIDLTSEKRFTLSKHTKKIIKNLDDIVFFKIYLEGDLPAQYKRLRNETLYMLNEFRSYSKNNIQFEFVDEISGKDRRIVHLFIEELRQKGIYPVIDREASGTEAKERIIIPGAIAVYKEREMPVYLLESTWQGSTAAGKENMINNSIQALEFQLADAIRKITATYKPKVAFIEGHGELQPVETSSATRLLSEYYNVERVKIDGQLKALDGFKCIIIARPDSAFSEKDKYIIDQFIMRGGKALWLIDAVYADMDSLRNANEMIAFSKRLNLEDMLFKWGVRINTDLVMDINGAPVPLMTGMVGTQPQFEFFTWYFFPLILSNQKHPIVKNLDPIKLDFANSIDTVAGKGLKTTALLTTSAFSRKLNTPATVSLDIMREKPDRNLFNRSNILVGVLVEGEFESVFLNRLPPEITESPEINYRQSSIPTKMVFVSDGDVVKNQFTYKDGRYITYPLGYDRYTNTTYGNANFILNVMNYLCDENNLLEIRARELKIRLLDKTKISQEKIKWQFLNMTVPLLFILSIGLFVFLLRKKIYG